MDTRQQHNAKVSPDEWYTPRWIIDTLGSFDLIYENDPDFALGEEYVKKNREKAIKELDNE